MAGDAAIHRHANAEENFISSNLIHSLTPSFHHLTPAIHTILHIRLTL